MINRTKATLSWAKKIVMGFVWVMGAIVTAYVLRDHVLGDQPIIKLVGSSVNCERPDSNCLLTFTVNNNGSGTGDVENVILRVAGIKNIATILPRPTFGNDTVDIGDMRSPGQAKGAKIGMEVQPKTTEVFTVLLRAPLDGYTARSWNFEITLETSSGDIKLDEPLKIEM